VNEFTITHDTWHDVAAIEFLPGDLGVVRLGLSIQPRADHQDGTVVRSRPTRSGERGDPGAGRRRALPTLGIPVGGRGITEVETTRAVGGRTAASRGIESATRRLGMACPRDTVSRCEFVSGPWQRW
jgi:hypothetical protein